MEPIASTVDPAAAACMAWLALDWEVGELTQQWERLEACLSDAHEWFSLSADQQLDLPEGRELYRVDELRSHVRHERDELLREIPSLRATSPTAVLFKLAVAAALVDPESHPDAHALMASCLEDLAAL